MTESHQFVVRYWGVTGSFARVLTANDIQDKIVKAVIALHHDGTLRQFATPSDDASLAALVRSSLTTNFLDSFGGNTTCIEIRTPSATFLIDAGTGLQAWGAHLDARIRAGLISPPLNVHLLITHAHLDHTCALPFVDQFYDQRNQFVIWARRSVLDQLGTLMNQNGSMHNTLFPTTLEMLKGIRQMRELPVDAEVEIADTRVLSQALDHPGGSLALRLERDERSVVVATDHEHRSTPDTSLANFAWETDLLYLDAQYTHDEYEGRVGIGQTAPQPRHGWGHSCIESCVETAVAARARRLHLGHHDPRRSDEQLWALERLAQACLVPDRHIPEIRLAREGQQLEF